MPSPNSFSLITDITIRVETGPKDIQDELSFVVQGIEAIGQDLSNFPMIEALIEASKKHMQQ